MARSCRRCCPAWTVLEAECPQTKHAEVLQSLQIFFVRTPPSNSSNIWIRGDKRIPVFSMGSLGVQQKQANTVAVRSDRMNLSGNSRQAAYL